MENTMANIKAVKAEIRQTKKTLSDLEAKLEKLKAQSRKEDCDRGEKIYIDEKLTVTNYRLGKLTVKAKLTSRSFNEYEVTATRFGKPAITLAKNCRNPNSVARAWLWENN